MDFTVFQHALVECVPNFSEGRDDAKIQAIVDAIAEVEGVYILHVDKGIDANRTVVTFAGHPLAVAEAAFAGAKKATELIDMRLHKGEHPRLGAMDVCPLIPIRHINFDELLSVAESLAERLGNELNIPVFLYEKSAKAEYRTRLEQIRKGQYEAMAKRMEHPEWQPDYGPTQFNPKTGATVLGVRDFLLAYNVNLTTKDAAIAQTIAERIRESGYTRTDVDGSKTKMRGLIPNVKAIGWYMDAFGCAQVSTNITNIHETPVHMVYEAISDLAKEFGTEVNGSELIGLIPKQVLLDAGTYAIRRDKEVMQVNEDVIIRKAITYLGLDALQKFNPIERVLEFALGMAYKKKRQD